MFNAVWRGLRHHLCCKTELGQCSLSFFFLTIYGKVFTDNDGIKRKGHSVLYQWLCFKLLSCNKIMR